MSDAPIERKVDAPATDTVKLSTAPSTHKLVPVAISDAPATTEMVDEGAENAEDHKLPPLVATDVRVTPEPDIRIVAVACAPSPIQL